VEDPHSEKGSSSRPEPIAWDEWARATGAWVRRVRIILGLSQHALARRVGVSQAAVSPLEGGRANVMAVPAFLRVIGGLMQGLLALDASVLHEDLRRQLGLYGDIVQALQRGAPQWGEVAQDPGAEEVLGLYLGVARERRVAFIGALKTVAEAFGAAPRVDAGTPSEEPPES
jgi:transcriptional regulator with XRE-family HTH domain